MVRIALLGTAILVVTAVLIPFQWLAVLFELPARRQIPMLYHRFICALFGVRVNVVGERRHDHPLLIVSNHVSWLDISVISSVTPVVFVARHDVADWPFFGLLAKLQRTIFVDRKQPLKTAEVNAEIAHRLAGGDPVLLFAEGTSSDGNRVLPFRSALIGSARDTLAEASYVRRVWIQPLSIAYIGMLGLPLGRLHRPVVAWYGDLTLLPHLAGVGRRRAFDVTLTWGEPVAFDANSDRKVVTRTLEHAVRRLTTGALRGRDLAEARA